MNDVTKVDTRSIQNKLLDWDRPQKPLAPLTSLQEDAIVSLSEVFSSRPFPVGLQGENDDSSKDSDVAEVEDHLKLSPSFTDLVRGQIRIETSQQFLNWYFGVEEELVKENDVVYESYQKQLEQHRDECSVLLNQIETALSDLGILNEQYQLVSTKTNSLHEVSEHLLSEQNKLIDIANEVEKRLHYFTEVDRLMSRLESPTLSPSSEAFIRILDKLDECIEYMCSHPKYKESSAYLAKYKHALGRAVALARSYVVNTFESATRQAQESTADAGSGSTADPSAKTFALLYGRFRASAPRVRELLKQVESRLDRSPEYRHLLSECHQCYVTQREQIVGESVAAGVAELTQPPSQVGSGGGGKEGPGQGPKSPTGTLWRGGSGIPGLRGDHCAIFRSACAFLVRVCEDEYQLFFQFFSAPSQLLTFSASDIVLARWRSVDNTLQHRHGQGVPMGSPLSPAIANFFMEDFEEKALRTAKLRPRYFFRYVDDTFIVWPHGPAALNEFLEHMNSVHPNIRFTMEKEDNGQLPFLDILIKKREDGTLSHSVYRKPTHTDLYLNGESHHHPSQKRSVLSTLLHRRSSEACFGIAPILWPEDI
ncbi:conserved oligomeric Golgi complex subunit 3-like [Hetaerina americana]|uniref:conserved oligomeric Golgi complex subunit 3-like n=1 Tax=Hetaerina americana TaxID=62018 RepID=UPI003A7F2A41